MYIYREIEYLLEHVSLWHFSWHQLQREQCRQEQKCQLSQHQAQQAWSSQKPQH